MAMVLPCLEPCKSLRSLRRKRGRTRRRRERPRSQYWPSKSSDRRDDVSVRGDRSFSYSVSDNILDLQLPASKPGSPYVLPAVPSDLPPLPLSPVGSPILSPSSVQLLVSDPTPLYRLPADPVSSVDSPTLSPSSVQSPVIDPASFYQLPADSVSPVDSPTLFPSSVQLPASDPASFYQLPADPVSPVSSPTLLPYSIRLPVSNPESPYQLPTLPADLPSLPPSVSTSPTLLPSEVALPASRLGSPYLPYEIPRELPELPLSPIESPTVVAEEIKEIKEVEEIKEVKEIEEVEEVEEIEQTRSEQTSPYIPPYGLAEHPRYILHPEDVVLPKALTVYRLCRHTTPSHQRARRSSFHKHRKCYHCQLILRSCMPISRAEKSHYSNSCYVSLKKIPGSSNAAFHLQILQHPKVAS
ncbi:hypothetical protein K440DRAFT_296819 [Wilcoxina mikolae CBS 423.85]|nr:hypothetical protein K440DRAFT_296819 [Wilcoxina mikolae CBS 423.85]